MTKEEVVRSFQSGFDCGQTVLRHCAAALGLDEKTAGRISTGFGGGSGRGETCGAVIGAYLALGLKYGCDETGEAGAEQKVRWMKKNAEFCEKFQAKYPGFTCREILGVDLSKASQSSDWAATTLSKDQLDYAASDVLHLHKLKATLEMMLAREGRMHLAEAAFKFLPTRAALDLLGWGEDDIFAH